MEINLVLDEAIEEQPLLNNFSVNGETLINFTPTP
jgi:hypothetical protein